MKQLISIPLKHILDNSELMESLITQEDEAGTPLFSVLFNPVEFEEIEVLNKEDMNTRGIGDHFFIEQIKNKISSPIFKQEVKTNQQVFVFTIYIADDIYMSVSLEIGDKTRYFYGFLNKEVELLMEV